MRKDLLRGLLNPLTRGASAGVRRLRPAQGQALVEFALVVPVLVLAIAGILDFSRAMNYQNDETHLANEAVRYASVGSCGGCSSIPTTVAGDADTSELRNNVSVSLCMPNGTSNLG